MTSSRKNRLSLFLSLLWIFWMPVAAMQGLSINAWVAPKNEKYAVADLIEAGNHKELNRLLVTYPIDLSVPFSVKFYRIDYNFNKKYMMFGYRLIHFVVSEGDKEMLLMILPYNPSLGARIVSSLNDSEIEDFTPLHLAVYKGQEEMVALFIAIEMIPLRRRLAELWLRKNGQNMTQIVLSYIGSPITGEAPKLLDARVIDNAYGYEGFYAIHIAAKKGYHSIVKRLLICNKSFANLRTKQGDCPRRLAEVAGHAKVVEVFVALAPSAM